MNLLFLASSSVIMSIASFLMVLLVIAWGKYMFTKGHSEEAIAEVFTKDFNSKLMIIAILATGTEGIGLTIIAIENGIDLFNAIMRYTILMFLELGCTFVFLQLSTLIQKKIIDKIFEDDELHLFEAIWFLPYIILIMPLLIFFSYPTYLIALSYYSSIGAITLVFNDMSMIPWEQFKVVRNPTAVPIQLGALFLIYFGPFLNLAQVILLPILNVRKKLKENDDDYDEEEDDDENFLDDEEDIDPVGAKHKTKNDKILANFMPIIEGLSKALNVSKDKLTENTISLLGLKGTTAHTNPAIVNKSKTVDKVVMELTDLLNGKSDPKDPSGLLGYWWAEKEQKNFEKILQSLTKQIEENEAKLVAEYDDAAKKLLESTIATLEDEKKKSKESVSKVTTKKAAILKTLTENCKDCGLTK